MQSLSWKSYHNPAIPRTSVGSARRRLRLQARCASPRASAAATAGSLPTLHIRVLTALSLILLYSLYRGHCAGRHHRSDTLANSKRQEEYIADQESVINCSDYRYSCAPELSDSSCGRLEKLGGRLYASKISTSDCCVHFPHDSMRRMMIQKSQSKDPRFAKQEKRRSITW